jgi:membrane associated rhomboid family serine protease
MSSSIRRGTTFKTIKRSATTATKTLQRSATYKTIKRTGTNAWQWINADDTEVSEARPVGISFFQRNDTFRKLNEQTDNKLKKSMTLSRRPTTRPSVRRRPRPPEALPLHSNDTTHNQNAYYMNLDDTNGAYGNDIKRPDEAYSGGNKSKKDDLSRIPSVLFDPKVRKQIEEMKPHKPVFMYIVTVLQIGMMIASMVLNFMYTGSPVDSIKNNVMIGPEGAALVHLGARFSPCIKNVYAPDMVFECNKGIKGSVPTNGTYACTISDVCGMGMKQGAEPNQWFRFITPIFLHSGILHILFNLIFQVRTGLDMERDFGSWRIGIIYMATGIFGFVFGASNAKALSVGCSGSLYGLIGCLFLDLFQSWRLIVNPWKELIKMLIVIFFSLGIGLINFIDNSAHVGGFISGILTGLIFLPTISFSKWDLRIKRGLMIISIFVTTFAFHWVFRSFYSSDNPCNWCKYIICIDYKFWCANYE